MTVYPMRMLFLIESRPPATQYVQTLLHCLSESKYSMPLS